MLKDTQNVGKKQESQQKSEELAQHCAKFLLPFLRRLNEHVDRRIVKTLLDLVLIIVIHRHRNQALILSELGGELLGEAHAPAGTKRISNLLHSKQWKAEEISAELWRQGEERVTQLHEAGEEALVIWDESENEKPESIAVEGLCAVRSSKAARLKRIKPGFYNPPDGRPIFVPGFHWLQILVVGLQGVPYLTHLHWWTSRGEQASDKRSEELPILTRLAQQWAERVIHVFDQGFAGSPWVQALLADPRLRFVLRWKKGYKLLGPDGQAKLAWQLARGKRSMGHKELWDARRRRHFTAGIVFLPVQLPDNPHPLWLVVSRSGSGRKPWYLLTNLPLNSVEDAWHIVFIYARRWQVEMALRYDKTELGFESPRVHAWETRMKFLGIAALAHAFLLLLLAPHFDKLKLWLLDQWCHRNGKWSQETQIPLYRLRLALSQLWRAFRPNYLPILDSG
jgi:hypothetical protein